MKKVMILFFIMSLFACSVTAYQISDDLVYVNDSGVYLGATPHTLTGDGEVIVGLISKQFSGKVDVGFGFNLSQTIPSNPMYWGSIVNGSNVTEGWKELSGFTKFYFDYDGKDTWYVLKNFNVDAGTLYKAKFYLDVIGEGKYDVCIKPSAETFQQAILNGHLLCLDPWWNETDSIAVENYLSNYWDDLDNGSSTTHARPIFIEEDSLVDGWTFDVTGTPTSSMIGKNDGTVTGATWTADCGVSGGCYSFDGDDYITLPNNMLDSYNTGTFNAWINFSTFATNPRILGVGSTSSANPVLNFYIDSSDSKLYFVFRNDAAGGLSYISVNIAMVINTEYMISITSDGSTWKIYVNGILQNVTVGAGTNSGQWYNDLGTTYTHTYTIGAYRGTSTSGYATGKIDEPTIYNKALSQEAITKLYNDGASRRYEQVNLQNDYFFSSNLISMWAFENNTLDELYQNSGTNNGATYTANGKIGGAYDFAQNTDYIRIEDSASIDNHQQMTIYMWYKGTDTTTNANFLMKSNGGADYQWLLNGASLAGYLDCNPLTSVGGGVANVRSSSPGIYDGDWHLITCVLDNGVNGTLYVDGILVAYDDTWVGTWNYEGAGYIHIGDRQDGGVGKIGLYDEIVIYNTIHNITQIQQIYNATNTEGTRYDTTKNKYYSIINNTNTTINWVVPTINWTGTAPTLSIGTDNNTAYTTVSNGTNTTIPSSSWLSFNFTLGLNTIIWNLGMSSGYTEVIIPPINETGNITAEELQEILEEKEKMIGLIIIWVALLVLSMWRKMGALLMMTGILGIFLFLTSDYSIYIICIGGGINILFIYAGSEMRNI